MKISNELNNAILLNRLLDDKLIDWIGARKNIVAIDGLVIVLDINKKELDKMGMTARCCRCGSYGHIKRSYRDNGGCVGNTPECSICDSLTYESLTDNHFEKMMNKMMNPDEYLTQTFKEGSEFIENREKFLNWQEHS